jgi:hydroxyacylglutathione hydrolase
VNQLQIEPIAAFADNYIWLLREPANSSASPSSSPSAAVVDPGDARPVLDYLRQQQLVLTSILITHHHRDHIGGLAALQAAWPGVEVVAPDDPRIPGATRRLPDQARFQPAGLGCELQVLAVPGHTSSHIAYLTTDVDPQALFCGDTLFSVGCGRVFDGTAEQLASSLRRLAARPANTLCYCAHEYTLENIGFARWVEPDNPALAERAAEAERLRAAGKPTLPATLASERAVNPFLRVDHPTVIAAAEAAAGHPLKGPTEVFTALRRWKDEAYD